MDEEKNRIVPWGLHPLDSWIVDELNRRSKEYGMNPKPTETSPYSGPRTAWVRVFSNGKSNRETAKGLHGFLLGGTFDFNASHGFRENNRAVIGLDAYGNEHTIDQSGLDVVPNGDFGARPPPAVTSMECELFGGQNASFPNLCRKVKINWRCNSLAQLNYMSPYFLTPRITLLVEWGWNNYDNAALTDLTDSKRIVDMFTNPVFTTAYVKISNGNYDAATGFITDYSYSLNEHGGYDCTTTITNANFLIEGQAHHNQSVSNRNPETNKNTAKKTLKEFIQNNLTNVNTPAGQETLKALNIGISDIDSKKFFAGNETGGCEANGEKMTWIRMDLLVDILNAFSSVALLDINGEPIKSSDPEKDGDEDIVRLNMLTIKDVIISAHPALKSVNKHILFPNELAPRLCSMGETRSNTNNNDIREKQIAASEGVAPVKYSTLFETVGKVVSQGTMDRSYDDLKSLINKSGRSFPMFEDYDNPAQGKLRAGYWGYLTDVFVSVELIKNLVDTNDTVLKFVEALIQYISQAMCNIAQLKALPLEYGNKYYSINDSNLTYVSTPNEASAIVPKIVLGATDSTFIRSAEFNVKIAAEMMNQLVAQSAGSGETTQKNSKVGVMSNDPKRFPPNRFSDGDRLFDHGALPATVDSNLNIEGATTEEAILKRKFESEDMFYTYSSGKGADAKKYILAEKNASFMTSILTGVYDPKATYMNNAIMPGTEFRMEILGMSGITYLSQFTLDHVPEAYDYTNAVWQVSNVRHKIENKMWTTSITAEVRPLTSLEGGA